MNTMLSKRIVFMAFVFTIGSLSAQNLSFYKENITMKIEGDYFYVTGIYYLQYSGQEMSTLVYPYPIDAQYGEVDSVKIYDLSSNEYIEPVYNKKSGTVFIIQGNSTGGIILQISYRQKLLANKAEYILTSTITWGKPLDKADYQLIIPKDYMIVNFSIPPDESIINEKEKVYYWSKEYYMPDRNMVFEFEK